MHIEIHNSLEEIPADHWNVLIDDGNPFLKHAFLLGLESTECTCADTGWKPCHIAVYDSAKRSQLLAAMPCYIKDHSYGEYIFDWSWANAFHRYGIDYYPKLSSAIPFTPATGSRLLISSQSENRDALASALIDTALELAEERDLSSFHSLFIKPEERALFKASEVSIRETMQFHWENNNYASFDEFLAALQSKKRKNIKRERRRVFEQEVSYRWLSDDELTPEVMQGMHQFYLRTTRYYGAQAYLNAAFFDYLATDFSSQTQILFAEFDNQVVAGGLFFKSEDTLYGRYWGALANFHSVHFETCYYQPIEWCINHGFKRFEAGAQGEHKLARGLEPTTTYSAHWIRRPEFRDAIDAFLRDEGQHNEHVKTVLSSHSPFKQSTLNSASDNQLTEKQSR